MSFVTLTTSHSRLSRGISHRLRRFLSNSRREKQPDESSRKNYGPPLAKFALPRSTTRAAFFPAEFPNDLEDRYVASYNWIAEAAQPTIAVPGIPPIWKVDKAPFPLDASHLTKEADEPKPKTKSINELSPPSIPALFAPLFAAADTMKTPVDWSTVDIIASLPALRLLMTCIYARQDLRTPFNFFAERAGSKNSCAIALWPMREGAAGGVVSDRPEGVTARARSQLTVAPLGNDYHRVVQMDLLDLRMLVTAPVAACLASDSSRFEFPPLRSLEAVSGLQHDLSIVQAGSRVPQADLLDVSMNTHAAPLIPSRRIASLFLAGIPQLYYGLFSYLPLVPKAELTSLTSVDLRSRKSTHFREGNADVYDVLALTLARIRDAVCDHAGSGRVCEVRVDGKEVHVYESRAAPSLIPKDARARFG